MPSVLKWNSGLGLGNNCPTQEKCRAAISFDRFRGNKKKLEKYPLYVFYEFSNRSAKLAGSWLEGYINVHICIFFVIRGSESVKKT